MSGGGVRLRLTYAQFFFYINFKISSRFMKIKQQKTFGMGTGYIDRRDPFYVPVAPCLMNILIYKM